MSRADRAERKAIALAIYPTILKASLEAKDCDVLAPAIEAFNYADAFLSIERLEAVDYCVATYTQEGEECPCPDCVSERLGLEDEDES